MDYKGAATKYSSGEMSALKTFSFTEPTVDYLASDSGIWAQLQERNCRGEWEVYERVLEGQPLSRKRGVVCIVNSSKRKIEDNKVPNYIAREALGENDNLIVHIGDLLYTTDWPIVKAFREHLEARKSVDAGFYYISDIASRLERLKAKKKAEAFEEDIKTFADAHGISSLMFSQWSVVMDYKAKRDDLSHPLRSEGIRVLQAAIASDVPVVQPCKDAVSAMLALGQELKLF